MFSFCTPLMINGSAKWGVKTGFLYVNSPLFLKIVHKDMLTLSSQISFAAAGSIAVVIAWFILPEVARRTPAEIDEM